MKIYIFLAALVAIALPANAATLATITIDNTVEIQSTDFNLFYSGDLDTLQESGTVQSAVGLGSSISPGDLITLTALIAANGNEIIDLTDDIVVSDTSFNDLLIGNLVDAFFGSPGDYIQLLFETTGGSLAPTFGTHFVATIDQFTGNYVLPTSLPDVFNGGTALVSTITINPAIPEPTTPALVLFGACAMIFTRSRRK